MAVIWLRKSAEQVETTAQVSIGGVYAERKGVPQEYVSAHIWYNLAPTNGKADAAFGRDALAAKMTPEYVSEAQ